MHTVTWQTVDVLDVTDRKTRQNFNEVKFRYML